MCGIAGFIDFNQRLGEERLRAIVNAMNETMVHRGPDDFGVWVDPTATCALAQRRLSIVDLSPRGHQPMVDRDRKIALTYNGEIYNFRELRATLKTQGFTFQSDCDTEVLLHLMADHNPAHLSALRGMFAFGHWDSRQRRLLLARDAFGKKPLYVARGNGWLAFASELRALESIEELDRSISTDAIADYLLLQYVHAPRTIYSSVEKVPPGHYMIVEPSGRTVCTPWFSFKAGGAVPGMELAPTYDERVEQLGAILECAIQRRLVSDVPLGAFLSGGVDSAIVVAIMRRLGVPTKTYSVGFEDSPDSEHVFAREIADHLGCDHHEMIVRPDAIELAPTIAAALDEPNGDSSCLPTNLLSEFTRQHVTVALSGDGGDEMFGGYGRYFDTLSEEANPPHGWRASEAYLGPRLSIFQPPDIERFLGRLPDTTRCELGRWCFNLDLNDRALIHRMRNCDVEAYLPGAVLAKVDRMSMQHSLEVRCPLLDVDVAAFAMALQAEDCVEVTTKPDGQPRYRSKRILKDVLARDLPREWIDRPKKGFGLPAGFWDGPALRNFAREVLDSPSTCLRDHLDGNELSKWVVEQEDPNVFSIYRLWPLLILELWLRARKPANAVIDTRPIPVASPVAGS